MLGLVSALLPLCLQALPGTELSFEDRELEAVPSVVGGELSTLPLLPGTSPLLSPVALSNVRGLQPATVGFYLDGLRLPWALHLFAGPPVLQDASLSGLTVQRGAPGVEHGRRLGGTVALTPQAPWREGLGAEVSLDLLRAGALAHWAGGDTQVSVGASTHWSPALLGAGLSDYYGRAEHAFEATSVRLLAVGALDAFGQASETDLLGAQLSFHRVDLRLTTPLSEGTAEVAATYGHDQGAAELGGAVAHQRARVVERLGGLRGKWTSLARPWGDVQVGFDVERRWARLTQRWYADAPIVEGGPGDDPPIEAGVSHPIASAVMGGVHAQGRLWLWDATQLNVGARADLWQLDGDAPRFTVSPGLRVDQSVVAGVSMSGGVALVHQAPTWLVPLPGAELAGLRFGLQEAWRTEGALVLAPGGSPWTLRFDAFVDVLTRTLELSPLDGDFLQTVRGEADDVTARREGRGHAWGAETLLRRQGPGGWFGWLSAGVQQGQRHVRFAGRNDFGEPVEERSELLRTPWDRTFTSTAFAGRRLGPWTVSAAARFHTGALEAGGLGSATRREGQDRLRPGPVWRDADRDDQATLPPYFRLDARVAYDFRAGPLALTASLDVQNLTFSREVTGYSYREEAASLEAEARGERTLTRERAGSPVPAFPLPMLGLRGRY